MAMDFNFNFTALLLFPYNAAFSYHHYIKSVNFQNIQKYIFHPFFHGNFITFFHITFNPKHQSKKRDTPLDEKNILFCIAFFSFFRMLPLEAKKSPSLFVCLRTPAFTIFVPSLLYAPKNSIRQNFLMTRPAIKL